MRGGAVAFPTVPTAGASRVLTGYQANTTGTRTFPSLTGLTKNSGDLLIAICIAYQSSTTNAQFSGWTGSFNEFHDSGTGTTMAIGAAYKWSDGTETGTFAVTQAATITGHACFILLSIAGAHPSSIPEAGSRASGTSAAADPGSFDPSWAAEDILWIAVGGAGEVSTTAAWTGLASAPTSYTDYADTGLGGQDVAGAVEGAVGFRQLNATSTDVGTFGVDIANARNAALVIAVRPAAVTDVNVPDAVAITATSEQPAAEVAPNAEAVAITAAALDATISTEAPGTNAPAECAEVTVTAEAASASIDPNAEAVAITAAAETASVSVDPNAEAVGITATAEAPSASIDPNAGAVGIAASSEIPTASVSPNAEGVAITAAAENATVETTGATNALAECAEATAEAVAASAEVSASAGEVAVTVSAETAAAALEVLAEAVAIVVAALDAEGDGDQPVGWSTPYVNATTPSRHSSRTEPGTYVSSTIGGLG